MPNEENLSKNPKGRQAGTPNKITRHLKDAILLAAAEVGDVGMYLADEEGKTTPEERGQLLGYLKWLAVNEPKSYVVLLGKLLPLKISDDMTPQPQKFNTREELEAELKRRGLPTAPIFKSAITILAKEMEKA